MNNKSSEARVIRLAGEKGTSENYIDDRTNVVPMEEKNKLIFLDKGSLIFGVFENEKPEALNSRKMGGFCNCLTLFVLCETRSLRRLFPPFLTRRLMLNGALFKASSRRDEALFASWLGLSRSGIKP